jgi:hypothetical protein
MRRAENRRVRQKTDEKDRKKLRKQITGDERQITDENTDNRRRKLIKDEKRRK